MEASKSFKELMDQIEDSKLNYVIFKTPFSANISVKRSFIKYHDEPSQKETEVKEENETPTSKNEILLLKSQLLSEIGKNKNLEELLRQKTVKVNNLQSELKESRENLSTANKDKKASLMKLKTLEKESASHKQHILEINQNLEDIEKEVKEKANTVKVKDAACRKFKKEKEEIANKFNETVQELKNVRNKKLSNEIRCSLCDLNVESRAQLNAHKFSCHYKDKTCQTSLTEPSESLILNKDYKCFYCDKEIISESYLLQHRLNCHGISETPSLFSLPVRCPPKQLSLGFSCTNPGVPSLSKCGSCEWTGSGGTDLEEHIKVEHVDQKSQVPNVFPCSECGKMSTSMEDLLEHMNAYHPVASATEEIYYCDVCPLYFENDINLQFHKRGFHLNHV